MALKTFYMGQWRTVISEKWAPNEMSPTIVWSYCLEVSKSQHRGEMGEWKGTDSATVQWSHWVKWTSGQSWESGETKVARFHRAAEGKAAGREQSAVLPKVFCWILDSPCMWWNYLSPRKQTTKRIWGNSAWRSHRVGNSNCFNR